MISFLCYHTIMIRTQIQLTEEQHRRLHELAAQRGSSMAELVREGVEYVIERSTGDRRWRALRSVLGAGRDSRGSNDVAERHDDYFEEALRDEHGLR